MFLFGFAHTPDGEARCVGCPRALDAAGRRAGMGGGGARHYRQWRRNVCGGVVDFVEEVISSLPRKKASFTTFYY